MPDHLVGAAFDARTLRGVELRGARRFGREAEDEVVRVGEVALPPGVVERGEILDVEAFAGALRQLWADARFSTKRIAIGLDTSAAVIRRAEFPALDKNELKQASVFEIGELLSYPVEQALVSAVEVGRGRKLDPESDGETVSMLILAVEEAVILAQKEASERAGLQLVSTEAVPAALVPSITESAAVGEGGVGVLIDVSRIATDVVVHDRAGLLFARSITAGVSKESTSISDALEMELEILSGLSGEGPSGEPQTPSGAASGSGVATVVEGVRRTLHYFTSEVDDRAVERIVLCGPQSLAAGLALEMGEAFPNAEVLRHHRAQWPEGAPASAEFDDAVAVAQAATSPAGARSFDLVPESEQARRTDRLLLTVGVVIAILLSPLLFADATSRQAISADAASAADAAEATLEAVRVELASFEDDQAREDLADDQDERIGDLLAEDYGFTTVIRQLAEAMPTNTYLQSVRVQRSQGAEVPIGYGGPPPPATMTLTGVAADLNGVGRWMRSAEEIPSLDGIWLAQSALGPFGAGDQNAVVFTVDGVLVNSAVPVRTVGAE